MVNAVHPVRDPLVSAVSNLLRALGMQTDGSSVVIVVGKPDPQPQDRTVVTGPTAVGHLSDAVHSWARNSAAQPAPLVERQGAPRARGSGVDPSDFYGAWEGGALPLQFGPALSVDLHDAFRVWSRAHGARRIATLNAFVGAIQALPGVRKCRQRHHVDRGIQATQSMVLWPRGVGFEKSKDALTDQLRDFRDDLRAWRVQLRAEPQRGGR